MARNKPDGIVVDLSWAEGWPDAARYGRPFYHGGSVPAGVLGVLRTKGYTPIDFRDLEGDERIEAMFEATQTGVFDPSTAQMKAIELHLKRLQQKKPEEVEDKRGATLEFLELLQSMASKERPEWSKVAPEPTPAPQVAPSIIDDLLKGMT